MSNKIGLYFKNLLPNTVPVGDNFSFYFIKNSTTETVFLPEGVTSQVTFDFNNIFLGKRKPDNSSEFFQINKQNNFYFKTINGITAKNNQGYVNLTLDDVVKYGGTTNVIKINNNFLFSDTSDTDTLFFGSYKTELSLLNNLEKKTYIKNKFDRCIMVGHFGYNNTQTNQQFTNSTFLINKLYINYLTVSNSIFIGNNITVQEIANVNIYDNNLNLGGSYIDVDALSNNAQNKIEGNSFIKNLGYGNVNTDFKFTPKLNLTNVDTVLTYTNLDVLFRHANGIIQKINSVQLFKPLNDRIDTLITTTINLQSGITNNSTALTELTNNFNEHKLFYNYDTTIKNFLISFNTQIHVETNSFSVNLNQTNNSFLDNIIIAKYAANQESYINLNAKLILNNLYLPLTNNDPLFENKLTFNESSGEVGYEYDNDKFHTEKYDYSTLTLNKPIILKVVYNSYLINFHIENLTNISFLGGEEIVLDLLNTKINYWCESHQFVCTYKLGANTSYEESGILVYVKKDTPNKVYIKNITTDMLNFKISNGFQVSTLIF